MTGREKVEAAFLPQGTTEIAAVICYEEIYVRDHWRQLTDCPWWYQHEPRIEYQMAWRRHVIARTGQDWFGLAACAARKERAHLAIAEGPDGVFLTNNRTQEKTPLT